MDARKDPLRAEAIELLGRIAALETDLGGKGYAEGMAQRLASPSEIVTEKYVAGLRGSVKRMEASACTGATDPDGVLSHDGDTCPIHEADDGR